MSEKLEALFNRSAFTLAIAVARSQGLDEAATSDIHRRFADHLYSKGDYDAAMQQYLKTIGTLQPSYVIRKVWKL